MNVPTTITVFFDNQCPICRHEVALYKKLDKAERIDWIDLRTSRQLAADMGVGYDAAMELLHVLDAEGKLHIGLDGHLLMWSYLPAYHHLAALLRKYPRLAKTCDRYYRLFTRLRPGAFKKTACEGQCND